MGNGMFKNGVPTWLQHFLIWIGTSAVTVSALAFTAGVSYNSIGEKIENNKREVMHIAELSNQRELENKRARESLNNTARDLEVLKTSLKNIEKIQERMREDNRRVLDEILHRLDNMPNQPQQGKERFYGTPR